MGESIYFRKYGAKFHRTPFLGCEDLDFGSDEYWKCCITRHTSSLQHQVSAIIMRSFKHNSRIRCVLHL